MEPCMPTIDFSKYPLDKLGAEMIYYTFVRPERADSPGRGPKGRRLAQLFDIGVLERTVNVCVRGQLEFFF